MTQHKPQNNRSSSFLTVNALLYSLFLIPTIFSLLTFGLNDRLLSQQAVTVWQADFWHFPGCSSALSRIIADVLQALAIACLGWLFFQQSQQSLTKKQVLSWTAIFSVILVGVIPFHSSDLYGYLNRAFQQTIFNTNPYTTTVSQIPDWNHTAVLHAHWIDNPCPYGVFFAWLIKQTALLGSNLVWKTALLLKCLNAIVLMATTWMMGSVGSILRHKTPWKSAFWFGCNPLVLLHAVGNGHNDIMMAFLLLVAFWLIVSKTVGSQNINYTLALPLIGLSILTKYATIVTVPFIVLFYCWKKRFFALICGSMLTIGLGALLFSPYLDTSKPWLLSDMLSNAGKPQHSIVAMAAYALYYPAKWILPFFTTNSQTLAQETLESALSLLKALSVALLSGSLALAVSRGFRQTITTEKLLWFMVFSMSMLIMASSKFHPWYPVMVLPFAFLLPEGSRLRKFWMLLSLFQLAGFTVFQNLHVISQLVMIATPLWLSFQTKQTASDTKI